MKKKSIIMVLAVALIASAGLFAALPEKMDIDLSLGAGTSGFTLDDTSLRVMLDPEATVYFDGNNGLDTSLIFSTGSGLTEFGAEIGYAYRDSLTDDLDLALKGGFDYRGSFTDGSSRHGYGIYLGADVSVNFVEDWFLSVGIRDTMEFGHTTRIGDVSKTEGEFNNFLTVPRVAVGYTF